MVSLHVACSWLTALFIRAHLRFFGTSESLMKIFFKLRDINYNDISSKKSMEKI